jgi:NhaA family Na+:H+ antiporter
MVVMRRAGSTPRLFSRGSWAETRRIADILRQETVGGAILLFCTVLAMAWANSPWAGAYQTLRDTRVGTAALHLDLSVQAWTADGLLAIFFFVAGLELKREFVAGDLRDPRRAALPVVAAVGGMAVPALIYVLVNTGTGAGTLRGWAVPTPTDIAFALAVLAVISTHLPSALRTFLLTLAVVDDLLAITLIALFYTADLAVLALLLALLPLAAFGLLVRRRVRSWWLLLPLALATWALVHASGVHPTVAGVLLALTVPVHPERPAAGAPERPAAGAPETERGLAEHFEHRWRPLSAGVAVPVFAFFSAGVALGGLDGLASALGDRVALGILVGRIAGKLAGILGAAFLVARFTRAKLDESLSWADVAGLGVLAAVGFTVSLLIGELAFGVGSERFDHAKVALLAGSVLAALPATVVLRLRNRTYRALCAEEEVDANLDGVPDVYEERA